MNTCLGRFAVVISFVGLALAPLVAAESAISRLLSPDERIAVDVHVADKITYDVTIDDAPVMKAAAVSLQLEKITFGNGTKLLSTKTDEHDGIVTPPVRQKAASFRDLDRELYLVLVGRAEV